ncbi:HlyD family type I secretion periplasmic adaptor subunit [Bradyrhizobium sp. CSA112]|uniref:HlyD family type I secretion periplasmic adaptor subunit n=1 Tax=Bradyrhizobium sp. CSA112 TaxID=2699170 RepID=UPI0023AF8BF5|nr:HlyD family type I secretion periplasmic adaptor subunit [Bradyrhizobium sp. CSA112]MDE5451439.1 HlyD family type I secretion periplasmic adaptor subunit [Bradyrhizobium sp. CSA112]
MKPDDQRVIGRSLRLHALVGVAAILMLVFGVGGWAATTELSGAVIAPGNVIVEGSVKQIQHPTGGVVAELLVREGQIVDAGDVLVRLDATTTRANLAIVTKNLNELFARQARLEAERDNLSDVATPAELTVRLNAAAVRNVMERERRLFAHRREAREGQKGQLRERIAQLNEKIGGQAAQQEAKTEEIDLIEKELVGVRSLFSKGLVPIDRVNNLARAAARLNGERGALIAATAEARGHITEVELQLLQVDQTLRSEVATELRDVNVRQGELLEREVTAKDQLSRVELRAPIRGLVHQLAIHTIGGVITPAEALMRIVPQGTDLTVEARVAAKDIDQIALQQSAILRLTAFNRNTTPQLSGTVTRISGDVVKDDSGATYYRVGIAISQDELAKLGKLTLIPGMPAESYILTGDRTVLSYFAKPLRDHTHRIFRED